MKQQELSILNKIGEGGQANVQLCEDLNGNQQALKIFTRQPDVRAKTQSLFITEISAEKQAHPNLIRTISYLSVDQVPIKQPTDVPAILLEHALHGDLFQYIYNTGAFSENTSKILVKGLVCGLSQLRSCNMSHLDIKMENVLLDVDQTPKLADFGMSQRLKLANKKFKVGTLQQRSPQILQAVPQNTEKADVWSLGVLLMLLLNRNPFFTSADVHDFRFNQLIYMGKLRTVLKQNQPSALFKIVKCSKNDRDLKNFPILTDECIDMLSGMLEYEEVKRFSIDQIANHPWVLDPANFELMLQEFQHKEIILKSNIQDSESTHSSCF